MKTEVLSELIKRWQAKQANEVRDGSDNESARIANAKQDGYEKGRSDCARDLISLIEILG